MMFGYSDEWAAVLWGLGLLWMPFGPFIMLGLGILTARARPGRSRTVARTCSVVIPGIPVGAAAALMFATGDSPPTRGDVTGFFGVFVGLLTVLPWLLSYGLTRLWAARKKR
ncbi:hypothetical protein ABZZ17_07385 [Streptomyces sp. NPDC006512]|uniref:hypothetical protein n=1 Tax=Streptomyces sp. NPDC006512 TaxID=3154307 RepID=UPI0033A6FDD1